MPFAGFFLAEVPAPSWIYDEKLLRARHTEGSLDVEVSEKPPKAASAAAGGESMAMSVEKLS